MMLITNKSYSDLKDSLMKTLSHCCVHKYVKPNQSFSIHLNQLGFYITPQSLEVWNLYEFHYMDVFMMMISDTYGTTFLGTGKLKQLMSLMSSLVGNRLHDNEFFSNISAETVCNEFRFTEYEKDIDFITEIAKTMISSTNIHVLVIVANTEGRKFIFSTDHVKPYVTSPVTSSFIQKWIGNPLYESDTDVDK